MLYPKRAEKTLSTKLFQNPTREYRGTPFWSWNCKITEDLVRDQIDIFEAMGMGGFHVHPRTGLATPYMGKEYLDLVSLANEIAKEKDMLCWLYDEDRYPSGAAGGIVTENWNYRARYLVLSQQDKKEMCQDAKEFSEKIAAGEPVVGYYLTSYDITLTEGYLTSYQRISKRERTKGTKWHAYVRLLDESPWFNDQTYLDVFNQEAVKAFIQTTHEPYYQKLGKDFGTSIPAIFTDEPHMKGKYTLPFATADKDITIAFTDDMPETFLKEFGVDLLDIIPEIPWELPKGKTSVHRYHYHDHVAERFVSGYVDTIADWCQEHDIALTGHYLSERTLYSQTLALGETMRCYRKQQLPGIDILADQKEFSTAKQAVSVTRQTGREGTLSELYGVMEWDCDFKDHKLQGDWQAALGITIRCHHLAFMSMEGEAKRDWPASISYQSPWYEKYPYVEDHFSRLNTALTRGVPLVKLGVIHPIESFWLAFGPNDQTQSRRDQLDENYENLMQWLLYGMIDFDLISESMLPELGGEPRDTFPVGEMAYDAVLVPSLETIRSTTLSRLEQFVEGGGTLVFAGDIPTLVDAVPSNRALELAKKAKVIPYNRAAMLEAFSDIREVEVRLQNGKLSDNMFYQLRQDENSRWLFLCHVNHKRNRLDQANYCNITIKGEWDVMLYDTITGDIREEVCWHTGGNTVIKKELFAHDSVLYRLTPVGEKRAEEPSMPQFARDKQQTIFHAESVTTDEPNALLLDKAKYSLNQGAVSEEMDILRLDNEVRLALGFPRRQDAFTQPWRLTAPPVYPDTVELFYEFYSETQVKGALLAMERPENATVTLNGSVVESQATGWYVDKFISTIALPSVVKGKNQLTVSLPFGRKSNLENLYILGDFAVESRGVNNWITEYSGPKDFGDLTRQGLPFYTGNAVYTSNLSLAKPMKDVVLEIPHYAGTLCQVSLDGKDKGIIAYAPHRVALGDLEKGSHTLEITVYGSRFNGFGTLHNANDEFMWYGPDSYRTYGSEWSEEYLVRKFGILARAELYYNE